MTGAKLAAQLLLDLPDDGPDGPSGPSIARALRVSGVLEEAVDLAHHPREPLALMNALAQLGQSSLSAGRIFEGHVNAVKLLNLHGGPIRPAKGGELYGIWGADGPDPVHIHNGVLQGQKLFASGADVLDQIIVTARSDRGLNLILFPRKVLHGRLFPHEWQVSGMTSTASGRCDLNGVALSDGVILGEPDSYLTEPHFHGGVWRYAAVQMGAMRRLTMITADQLRRRDQVKAPLQAMRLHGMITACETARLWLAQAATTVERSGATPSDAQAAILARLRTAQEAVALLGLMDQALGAASFATGHPADRIRRDLGLYLRQANPDGMALASTASIAADTNLSTRWIG
ncbi:acyl-CoA dehydrogenase [Paracoccus sp. JM45]|nr:acyl-CoA dehydrogenase [Paracoccus sp. JM45]